MNIILTEKQVKKATARTWGDFIPHVEDRIYPRMRRIVGYPMTPCSLIEEIEGIIQNLYTSEIFPVEILRWINSSLDKFLRNLLCSQEREKVLRIYWGWE